MRLAPSPHRACAHWPLRWRDLRRERRVGEGAPIRVRDGTLRLLGREESGRRSNPFDPASSSHHGRQRNLRISPFRRKLKTSCTRVTKTSSREDLRFFTKKNARLEGSDRASAAEQQRCTPRGHGQEIETFPRAQVGRWRKPIGNTWQQSSSLTPPNRKMCRGSCPRGSKLVSTGWTGPKDNERLEPMRCERPSGTYHQACLGDGFGQRQR